MNEIKHCPFCGPGNSIVECYQDDYGYWTVGCGRCGSHSGIRPKGDPEAREKVIANWNRRPDLAGSFTYDQYHDGCNAIRNERNRAQDEVERLNGLVEILNREIGEWEFDGPDGPTTVGKFIGADQQSAPEK